MRLRVVSSKKEIETLNPNEKIVHLGFRASNVDYLNLMQRCPRLKAIQMPPSYLKTMSNSIQVFMDMWDIETIEGDVWGHRKDLDEYFAVDDSTMKEVIALAEDGVSLEEITNQVKKNSELGSDLIKYIAKNKITA